MRCRPGRWRSPTGARPRAKASPRTRAKRRASRGLSHTAGGVMAKADMAVIATKGILTKPTTPHQACAEHLCLAIIVMYSCMHPTPHSRGGRQLLNSPHFKCVQLGTTPNPWATLAAQSVTRLFLTFTDDCCPSWPIYNVPLIHLLTLGNLLALMSLRLYATWQNTFGAFAAIRTPRTSVSQCNVHSVRCRQLQAERRAWLTPQCFGTVFIV